jgi:iron complex transport system permease protein
MLGLALLTLALVVVSVGTGEYRIAPLDVVRTLLGQPVADADYRFVVRSLRLPRTLVAALVGMALALSGAIMQGLTRNPLASPEITGVTGGASLAAVTLIVWLPAVSLAWLPIAALAGGLAVAGAIYALAWRGGDSPLRLILVGIGIGAVLSALITLMLTFGEVFQVQRALIWLTGSVYGRTWSDVRAILPWLALGVPAVLGMARHLNVLQLGPDIARGLGSAVEVQRAILLLLAVMLAAVAVTVAGTIGFVGLMAPHIARRLVGSSHEGLLPTTALVGALIVVASDLVGRTLFAPVEIPCGIVTAAVGAPFLIYVLYRRRARGG